MIVERAIIHLLTFQDELAIGWSWEEADDQWHVNVHIDPSHINQWKKGVKILKDVRGL